MTVSRWTSRLILALALPALLAVQTSAQQAAPPAADTVRNQVAPRSQQPENYLSKRAYNYYVNGLLMEGMEDYGSAAESYRKALSYHQDDYELKRCYAQMLVRLRQPFEALTALEDIEPADEPVLELRAAAYRQLGDDAAAREQYLAVVKLDSLNQSALVYLGTYYQRRGNLDSTIWAYAHLRLLQPYNYQLLNELGRIQILNGDVEAAKASFRSSLDVHPFPNNTQAFNSLAQVFEVSNQTDSLIELFEVGLQTDPGNVSLHNDLVNYYVRSERLPEALPHMKAVARINQGDLEASRRLGMLYMGLDSLEIADSILTNVVARGPAVYGDHFSLGMIAAATDHMDRARAELRKAIKLDRSRVEAWLNLAGVFLSQEQPDSAREVYHQAVDHMPDEASAVRVYFALGAAYEQAGMIDSSIQVFEEILKHQPNNDQALNYLGYTLADNNQQLEYARDLITRALEMQPNNPAYLDSYGWVHYRLGNYDTALVYLKSASDLDNDPVILDHLGDAYEAVGDNQKAREIWETILDRQPDNEAVREKLNR